MYIKLKKTISNYLYHLNTGVAVYRQNTYQAKKTDQLSQKSGKTWLHIILFLTTFTTTTFAGIHHGDSWPALFASGLSYSVTIMLIITFHEFGHYFAARRFSVSATLPFYIPFLTWPGTWIGFGTMGAVIKTRSPIPHRRALLYIGAMGPIPGFLVSLSAMYIGLFSSEVIALPEKLPGTVLRIYGDPLLLKALILLVHGTIPAGHEIFLSPVAWAGWIGFLLTSLNLMPIGQLDGGHILHALIGKKQRLVGWGALAVLSVMAFFFQGWILWIILTLSILKVGHPPIPEGDPLNAKDKIIGWSCMAVFILTFIPVPVAFV